MEKKENGIRRFLKRDWIQKGEGQLTYVQFFGFVLITLGVLYFASFFLLPCLELSKLTGSSEIAIAFFTTMMGVAFAFPDMLKGQSNEMSTMRITVFMFSNVICMLLLKIGWAKQSLSEIGLDSSWVGVIAFLFGAKAAQSYFENANKLGAKNTSSSDEAASAAKTTDSGKSGLSQLAIAQLAKVQNENKLRAQSSNIVSVSDSLSDGTSCLKLYLKDADISKIPAFVDVKLNEESVIKVQTKTIPNSGTAEPHISQSHDEIQDSLPQSLIGSICCLAKNDNGTVGIVTAGHNFSRGNFQNLGGFQYGDQQREVLLNGQVTGRLLYQKMDYMQDLAIVEVAEGPDLRDGYTSFNNCYYEVSHSDIQSTKNVIIESRPNKERKGPGTRDAYILDCNINYDFMYNGESHTMTNVILLGDSPSADLSKQVSLKGDSGSCVYHKDSNALIGILIGGTGKFSIVLPIKEILENIHFKTL